MGFVKLSDAERLALGQWTDTACGPSVAQTPDSHKQRLGRCGFLHVFDHGCDVGGDQRERCPGQVARRQWRIELRARMEDVPGMPP